MRKIDTTPAERRKLDELVGRAFINDDLHRSLISQRARREVLEVHQHHFQPATLEFLLAIGDKQHLAEFAYEVYVGLYPPAESSG